MQKTDAFKNLEAIYIAALTESNYTAAIKAQELLTKHTGVFETDKAETVVDCVQSMDWMELDSLIRLLEDELVAGEGLEPPTHGL